MIRGFWFRGVVVIFFVVTRLWPKPKSLSSNEGEEDKRSPPPQERYSLDIGDAALVKETRQVREGVCAAKLLAERHGGLPPTRRGREELVKTFIKHCLVALGV